jgi:hypothetical protein
MKIRFLSFVLLIGYLGCFAQDPAKNNKSVYQSEEKLYINKDLGVYLWLSTSPDPNSEKFRLLSDSSKKYANPMYFDTEGYNSFHSPSAVDTSSKQVIYPIQDIIFEIYADGLSPVSQAEINAKNAKVLEGKNYFRSNTEIKIKSNDAVSGITSILYSLNNEAFKEYTEPLVTFKEGENILKFFATDKVGNCEGTQTKTFFIDNTPPKTEYEIAGVLSDNYVSPDALIKLKSTDNLSGVKSIYYKIGNGNTVKYINPIPVSLIKSSNDQIAFYAEDNLGNTEKTIVIGGKSGNLQIQGSTGDVIFEFYVDKDPPVVKIELEGDQYNGKSKFISKRTQVKILADDEKSGLDKIFYGINQSPIDKTYQFPVNIENDGLNIFRVKAVDFVGNNSPVITNQFVCDNNPPVSAIAIGTPKLKSRDTLFISAKTPVTITVTDDLSGVSTSTYNFGNNEEVVYSKSFNIDESGHKVVTYYSTDKVNNIEAKKTIELFVDNIAPVIHHHFSVESIGTKNVRDEKYTIYPSNAMLYIAATDASSGGERIEYKINNGQVLIANPVSGLKPDNYLVEVSAFDVLGNKSSTEIKFSIEE